jgi:hypothetical protein
MIARALNQQGECFMSDLEKIDFVDFFTIGERVYWAVVPEGGDCGGKTLEQMKRWLGEANVYGPFESDDAAQADADKVVGEGVPVIDIDPLGSSARN